MARIRRFGRLRSAMCSPPSRPRASSGVLLVVLLAACVSSPGVEIPQGSRVMVRLYAANTGTLLELANLTHPDMTDVYSTERPSASLKLAPEAMLGVLLADLDAAGFERFSVEGPPMAAEPRGWLMVDDNGELRTFVVTREETDPERLAAFASMKLAFADLYREVGALQFVENPDGPRLFDPNRPAKRDEP